VTPTRPATGLGAAAVILYLPHAIWHIAHGSSWDLLWVCNVSMPVLAFGAFTKNARACVVAFLFLAYGTPIWLLDLVSGGGIVITSPLVHVLGLMAAAHAVRTFGWPPRTWIVAAAASAFVLGVSCAISPESANVNMAFRVYAGWETHFPNHVLYLAMMWGSATALFAILEAIARRFERRRNQSRSPGQRPSQC
jgi:hypothetical protein